MSENASRRRTPQLWIGLGGIALLSAVVLKGVIEGNRNAQVEGVVLLVIWSFLAGLVVGHRSGARHKLQSAPPVKENPELAR
ncbi:hypothetical protein [Streptomyces sp. Tue6028]|uniref:hypothetical protein n=1 Tax=Streptomyces sp. Tue6028 TaxID=2036037 RepID=UPI00118011EC|nr:hypothetical protein [Streptomyces sp. Tue6028]